MAEELFAAKLKDNPETVPLVPGRVPVGASPPDSVTGTLHVPFVPPVRVAVMVAAPPLTCAGTLEFDIAKVTSAFGSTTWIDRMPVPPVVPALGVIPIWQTPGAASAATTMPLATESPSAKLRGDTVGEVHAPVAVKETSTAPVLPPARETLTVVPAVVVLVARLVGPVMVKVPGPVVLLVPQATTTPPLGVTVMDE